MWADLDSYLEVCAQKAKDELSYLKEEDLLNENEEVIVATLLASSLPRPVDIQWDAPTRSPIVETTIERADPFGRGIVNIPGSKMTVSYPASGSTGILNYRASTSSLSPQYGKINTHSVTVVISDRELTSEKINAELTQVKRSVSSRVEWANRDLEKFRGKLKQILLRDCSIRKERILKQRAVEAAIDIPIWRKDAAPPIIRTEPKLVALEKRRSQEAFVPEPILEEAIYQDVLRVVSSWTKTFERNPGTFKKLHEEDLRDLLLANLNGYWQGAAGGELFNGEGKTDVLIRYGDRNAFIAECKIWSGKAVVEQAIDQLLSYMVWRDTKAALIMFIKTRKPEETITRLHSAVRQHSKYCMNSGSLHDSTWGEYIFVADEENRKISLAVIPVVIAERQ